MKIGPFSIEKSEGWTECDCPESLCPHTPDVGPQGMRSYDCWIVWDTDWVGDGDHAFITHPGFFEDEYRTRRDAADAAKRYLALHPVG